MLGVINLMDKNTVINLMLKGYSYRNIAQELNIDRKTVSKYCNEYKEECKKLEEGCDDYREIQNNIVNKPKYKSSNRKKRKYTKEIDTLLETILDDEENKFKKLGYRKQKLTHEEIYKIIAEKGYDVSFSTVSNNIRLKRDKTKECFIKQEYGLGDRLEYDFGEVRLEINNKKFNYYLAVLSSPAINFKWAYLYKNQKKDVFMDSHVNFFEMVKGSYKEVVYDNMKNVVTKFIGRNEKEFNESLLKMSNYYGFKINVTNCYKGNEKGHVENSVKIIRDKVFARNYQFDTFEEAREHLERKLNEINKNTKINEEMDHLLPYKPRLELAEIKENIVNKYSFVRVDKNDYSVPDYLVGRKVTIKVYYNELIVFSNNEYVCKHRKVDGSGLVEIDIKHYLNTFKKKPGAVKNSLALKKLPELKTIYDKYFIRNPKEFIDYLIKNKEKNVEEIVETLKKSKSKRIENIEVERNVLEYDNLNNLARKQVSMYNNLSVRS